MADVSDLPVEQSPLPFILIPHRTGFVWLTRIHPGEIPHMGAFEAWTAELEDTGELTPDIVERIVSLHGDRGARAIEAVGERRVKQYLDFTVVVGHSEEYVIEAGRCSCKDARYNLDRDDPSQRCWHELAVLIARYTEALDHHDLWYTEVHDFV